MRFWLACVLCVGGWPAIGFSQGPWTPGDGSIPRHAPPIPWLNPPIPSFGGSSGGGYHHGSHSRFGDRNCDYYGPGYSGYSSFSPYGYGYTGYTSVTYGVPGFSVGYSAPLFGNTYYGPSDGYSGWNSPIYIAPPVYVNTQPTLPALPQWMLDEARLGPAPAEKMRPISQTHRSLVRPSTPESQLRSVRLQDAGDRLFSALDYAAAEKSYAKSLQAAPDRPEPYVRLAVTKAARGNFRSAVAYLKQMADVDPSYPGRADSLGRLFGHQNGISKLQMKQGVAEWTTVDIRDPDRIFLLGTMLFLDGDDRFRTLLDTAVKLEGDQPYLSAFLDATPAQDNNLPAPTPDEIDALTAPAPVLPPKLSERQLPTLPGQRARPVQPPLLLPTLPEPPAP